MKGKLWKTLPDVLAILLGNLLSAACASLFILPGELLSAGTTGLSLVARALWGIPVLLPQPGLPVGVDRDSHPCSKLGFVEENPAPAGRTCLPLGEGGSRSETEEGKNVGVTELYGNSDKLPNIQPPIFGKLCSLFRPSLRTGAPSPKGKAYSLSSINSYLPGNEAKLISTI